MGRIELENKNLIGRVCLIYLTEFKIAPPCRMIGLSMDRTKWSAFRLSYM